MASVRPHGRFLAAEVGELAGVSGTTIGQWARRGLIRASQSTGDPHVYSVEDVAEATAVHALLARGITHALIRRTIPALRRYGNWPLSTAPLATTDAGGAPRIVLCEAGGAYVLGRRGWQRLAVEPPLRRLGPVAPFTGAAARAAPRTNGDRASSSPA